MVELDELTSHCQPFEGGPTETMHVSQLKPITKHGKLSDPTNDDMGGGDVTPPSPQPERLFWQSQQLQVMGISYKKNKPSYMDDPSDCDTSNDDQSSLTSGIKSALETTPLLVLNNEGLLCLSPMESHLSHGNQ